MFNLFAQSEKNLGRAGSLLILAVLSSIAFSLVLVGLRSDAVVAVFVLWAAMPFVAWFMPKAAHAQGKSRLVYGLASLFPPLAVALFLSLFNNDLIHKVSARASRRDA